MDTVLYRRARSREPAAIATSDPVHELDMAFAKLPSEIWIIIVRMLETQHSIKSLSESSSFFHTLATPILFEKIRLTKYDRVVDPNFQDVLDIPYLSCVRELRVEMGTGPTGTLSAQALARSYELFNRYLREAISRMTNLMSFSYGTLSLRLNGSGVRGYCESHAVPLLNNTLAPLRNHHQFRNLSIVMHGYADLAIQRQTSQVVNGFEEWALYVKEDSVALDLSGFRNLISLQVFDLAPCPDDPKMFAQQLASTLLASPKLRSFGIGFHLEHYHKKFLPVLWKVYKKMGGKPLALETLYIREGCTERPNSNIPYPKIAKMDVFTDPSKLRTLMVEYNPTMTRGTAGTADGITIENESMIHYTEHLQAIRKFSAKFLDSAAMDILTRICDNIFIPAKFMSELHFEECAYTSNDKDRLRLSSPKQKYWPTVFSIKSFESRADPAVKRQIIRGMCDWKGLTRLHLPLDLGVSEQRRFANALAKALKNHNLKVLSFAMVRSFVRQREDFESGADMRVYLENRRGQRIPYGVEISSDQQIESLEDRLAFTKRICHRGNIKYLGIFNTIFETRTANEVHTIPSEDDYPRLVNKPALPYKVVWLQQLTFNTKEYTEFLEPLMQDGIP